MRLSLPRNLPQLALPLRAEPAESDFLHPACDGAQ
jgi:hypothetical protein